jgi:hypothetical protein
MTTTCHDIHQLFSGLKRLRFPFDRSDIPANGIYILFEKGEIGHGVDRIVRIGTHTGNGQLPSRLHQHFLVENKDRSIFRKNIGRALLNAWSNPYLDIWNLDLTTRKAKDAYGHLVDSDKQSQIEQQVTEYLQGSLSFIVFPVEEKMDRLRLESRVISTVSLCEACRPSNGWLGLKSPKTKIRESGLWQVNELYKRPLTSIEVEELRKKLG